MFVKPLITLTFSLLALMISVWFPIDFFTTNRAPQCPVCPAPIVKLKQVQVVKEVNAPKELTINVVKQQPNSVPVRFWHESSTQFTDKEVASYVKQHGPNILIGGDPGFGSDFDEAMRACDRHRCLKHVYLVGPGMWSWSEEERNQIRDHARSVAIDVSHPNWHNQWLKDGWKLKQQQEFMYYDKRGFYSAEIDNIDSAIKQEDVDQYVAYVKQLIKFFKDNKMKIKLMVKNLNEDQLRGLFEAKINACDPKSHIAPYGMFEKGSGDPKEQIRLAAQLCIKAITPINGIRDTDNYGTTRNGVSKL